VFELCSLISKYAHPVSEPLDRVREPRHRLLSGERLQRELQRS